MTPEQAFQHLQKQLRNALFKLPKAVGDEAVNFSLDAFRNQGMPGQPWPKRKNPTKWGKVKRPERNLLIDTGRLRRSVRITSLTSDTVAIGTDVPYAKAHNEGVEATVIQAVDSFTRKNGSTVKAHARTIHINIPKRQFIGEHPALRQRLIHVFFKELKKNKL